MRFAFLDLEASYLRAYWLEHSISPEILYRKVAIDCVLDFWRPETFRREASSENKQKISKRFWGNRQKWAAPVPCAYYGCPCLWNR